MFPVITVDANDVVAIYRVAQESIARARDGGPTLIACVPYAAEGMSASPIANMERYLAGKKLFDDGGKTKPWLSSTRTWVRLVFLSPIL